MGTRGTLRTSLGLISSQRRHLRFPRSAHQNEWSLVERDRLAQLVTPICRDESLTEFHARLAKSLPNPSFSFSLSRDFKIRQLDDYCRDYRGVSDRVFLFEFVETLDIAQTLLLQRLSIIKLYILLWSLNEWLTVIVPRVFQTKYFIAKNAHWEGFRRSNYRSDLESYWHV